MQSIKVWRVCKCASYAGLTSVLLVAMMAAWLGPAWASGTVASAVLGQPDFTHRAPNGPDAASLYPGPSGYIAVDKSSTPNHLYVADRANNRVLGYNSVAALANGASADLVIGQPDFLTTGAGDDYLNSPTAVAVDSGGNVYVSDGGDNRVLVFSSPFVIKANTGQKAGFAPFMVLGQAGDFSTGGCNVGGSQPSQSTLCAPGGLALDSSNNLYVADWSNNRVLEFNNPVGTGNLSANMVFGQADFVHNSPNRGGSPSATTLSNPFGVALDSNGNLYVVDYANCRVLEYNTPLKPNTTANHIWGDGGSFLLSSCGSSATLLDLPTAVALDSANNLYIADSSNNRVLEYNETANPPTNTTPNLTFGQPNDTTFNGCNQSGTPSANTLCIPTGLALDSSNDLFVLDTANNRVLDYYESASPPTNVTANVVLGQLDFAHNAPNTLDGSRLYGPAQASLDQTVSPNHLYLADTFNNRVLGWRNATSFANGAAADLVIGQPDFQSSSCNPGGVSATNLCYPTGAVVDPNGNLYVADNQNSRVVEYTNPFATCASFPCVFGGSANLVFGQPNASSNGCNNPGLAATSLCYPGLVGLDGVGNLYVADSGNNRVLEYNTPLTKTSVSGSGDTTADLVFGQGTTGTGTEFTTNGCNQTALSGSSLCGPAAVATDPSNNVYIGDFNNNRVLEFNEPTNATTAPNNVVANTVFGQGSSLTANTCNNSGLSAGSLCTPAGVSLDSSGDLFVADLSNSRVLEYFTPLSSDSGTTADIVWGQGGDFLSNYCDIDAPIPSAATLCTPGAAVVDSSGNVFITDGSPYYYYYYYYYVYDYGNNRLLLFNPPFTPPGYGPSRPEPAVAAGPVGATTIQPSGLSFGAVAVGKQSEPQKLTVKNKGRAPVRLANIVSTDREFILGGTCGSFLPAGGSCTVTVTFRPVTTGKRGGQVLISDNTPKNPHAVRLSGLATPAKKGKKSR